MSTAIKHRNLRNSKVILIMRVDKTINTETQQHSSEKSRQKSERSWSWVVSIHSTSKTQDRATSSKVVAMRFRLKTATSRYNFSLDRYLHCMISRLLSLWRTCLHLAYGLRQNKQLRCNYRSGHCSLNITCFIWTVSACSCPTVT